MTEAKTITIGVPKETFPGEARVGLVPGVLKNLKRLGGTVIVETGAGDAAGFPDKEFEEKGARIKNGLEMLYLQAEESWEIWDK